MVCLLVVRMVCELRMTAQEALSQFGNISVSEEKPGRYYREVSGIYISIASKVSEAVVTVSEAISRGDTVAIGRVSGGFLYIQEMNRGY